MPKIYFSKINISFYLPILFVLLWNSSEAQQMYGVTFDHEGKTVYGTFTTPNGTGKFPVVIINPGTGANDRDGTITMVGANVSCLYPALLNQTLKPYKQLADALVDSGYAVLRYDKLEYTYPTNLGAITFEKLWLPVESAIDFIKTRQDVDTNKIILIGHSEGSALIPFIAKDRNDVQALISIAGSRTPFDSLLAYQLVYIAQTCGGNVPQAQSQASQILTYYDLIRTNTWDSSTPPLFGVPASEWYQYVLATDPVAANYNFNNLPTLFIGLGADINVPPSELARFQNEVTITNDFWLLPGLIHYMTPNNDPNVSTALTDTIIYWLNRQGFMTGVNEYLRNNNSIQVYPNPVSNSITINIEKQNYKNVSVTIFDIQGKQFYSDKMKRSIKTIDLEFLQKGVYLIEVNVDGDRNVKRFVKE